MLPNRASLAALALVLLAAWPALGQGMVVITGDDADDAGHCQGVRCGRLYPNVFSEAVARSRSGGSGILAVGVNGSNALVGFNSWNSAANGGPGAAVTHVRSAADIAAADFEGFAMVYVPSTFRQTGGGINDSQVAALNARQEDLAVFVNERGGSLVALTQAGAAGAWGFLPVPLETAPLGYQDAEPTGDLLEISPTTTRSNLSHCCFHNIFTGPPGFSGLDVLARRPSNGQVVMVGGIGSILTAELCDDGIDNDEDGLVDKQDPDCRLCGDGVVDVGEQCDDGGIDDGDGCSATCELESLPPVALCQDAALFTGFGSCSADASVDAGSFDPEGEGLSLVQSPPGPFAPGTTAVTLEATDPVGAAATCQADVTVIDREPPAVSCEAPALLAGGGAPLTFTAATSDNCQAAAAVRVEVSEASCRNDDLDGDGVPDDIDACAGSDLADVLAIGRCVTGVENHLFASGCTFSDLAIECAEGAANHGDFVSCVAELTNGWMFDGLIDGEEKGRIESCAARSPIPAGSTGAAGRAAAASGAPCAVTVEGDAVHFPEPPGIGLLRWTVTATDGFGNTASRQCEVVLQDPETPLPNLPPAAHAGAGGAVLRGVTVRLDGSASHDLDGDALDFLWRLEPPAGSAASLSDPAAESPTFVADLAGSYRAELVVSDGTAESAPAAVLVVALNSPPVAAAGGDRSAFVGEEVVLDGGGSVDPDGDPLGYAWELVFQPQGSVAALSDPAAPAVRLTGDLRGTYVARLRVDDGELSSLLDAAVLRVPNAPPVADAGPRQEVSVLDVVRLDGSASSDLEGDPLAYQWSLLSIPAGSAAALSQPTVVDPTLVADVAGTYVVQLVVSDGRDASAPATVEVVTVNTPPIADAGDDQTVFVTDLAQLDGSGSADADGDPLRYAWTFVSRPPGSAATLSDAAAVAPTYVVDRPGVYVLELVVADGLRSSPPDRVTITTANSPPVADAGADQSVFVTDTVLLDGGGSFDVDGDPLTFAWSLVSRPTGSAAAIADPASPRPSFVADAPGTYVVELVVHDGTVAGAPDRTTVITLNSPPVADAGADQTVFVTGTAILDGSRSSDVDGDPLTYAWTLVERPAGSTAALSDPAAVAPSLVADRAGTYVVELVVHDGTAASAPDAVTVTTVNSAPVADAGADQSVELGATVQLDGSGSTDVDGDPLTYAWRLLELPAGSAAALLDPFAPTSSFVVDQPGVYVVELVVHDGTAESAPDTVTISTGNLPPIADAGADQTVLVGDLVQLDGAGSSDPDGDPLAFRWSLLSVPAGSAAALSDPLAAAPRFVADLPGSYVAQLIVDDGALESEPDTVTIATGNSRPVAVAGADRVVAVGETVSLDGTGSHDADGDPLSYRWSLSSVPAGSAAVLDDPRSPTPRFVADVLGSYVAQLIVGDGALDSEPDTVRVEAIDRVVTVPHVVGLAQADAEAAIVAAGLVVGTVQPQPSASVPAGRVILQDPAGGVTAAEGSAVDLVVSTGPDAAPVVALAAPAADAVLTAPVDVVGTASDDGLVRYELSYALVGSGHEVPFAEGAASVVDGVLGVLDPTLLPNGTYEIVLRAFDASQVASTSRVVRVDGQRKVGHFTVSFHDVVVPVAGIPITVTRTYDSRRKLSGDFGFGWTLGVSQGDYANNRPPGEGWQILTGGGFLQLPCQQVEETASHVTEVRLSDAEAYFFRLQLVSPAAPLGGCFATARFAPLPGNLSARLEIVGDDQVLYLNGTDEVLDAATLETFEPEQVRLLTPDGRRIVLDLDAGIASVRDVHGNGIDIGAGGITHTAGAGVLFQRDAVGRIQRISRPDGSFLDYLYDPAGDLVEVIDGEGAATALSYDSEHLLVGMIDGRGVPMLRNEYDDAGRLIATTDAGGGRLEFEHDLAGNREIYRDRLGNLRIFLYDDAGNVVSQTDELGHTTLSAYDSDGNLLSVTDPLGHTRTMTYDADGNLLSEADALGNTTVRTYGAFGLPVTETDAAGATTTHVYDAAGNLLSTTDPLGHQTTFTVDAAGNPLTVTDARGFVTSHTYDAQGRETSRTDAEGDTVAWTYDANGNRLTEARTRTVGGQAVVETARFEYDAEGRVVARTDRTGATTRTEYDAVGQIAARVDALGNRTEIDYDFHGNPVEIRYPDGTSESFEHDAEGRKTAVTDRAGRTTRFALDAAGRVVATTHPDGAVERVAYDAAGRKVAETDARGHTTTFAYDAAGRLLSVRDPLGHTTTYAYDAAGRKVAETDALGHTTGCEYDLAGRLVRRLHPDGTETRFEYDAAGNRVREIDPAGRATELSYDGLGRLVQVVDALGGTTSYGYDEAGNRVSIADANGHATAVEHDGEGREVRRTLPLGQEIVHEHDAAGNLVRRVDANGQEVRFGHDADGRVIRRVLPDGTVEELTYTATGQVATETDARGTTRFTYDLRDRLVRQDNPDGTFLTYTYDAAGNRTSVGTPGGTTAYTFDALDRVATVVDADGGVTRYEYDAAGKLASAVNPNGTETRYTYDPLGRLLRLEHLRSDGGVLAAYDYTLGPAGNRVRSVESSGRVVDYDYDALYRLTREAVSGTAAATVAEYTFDAVGNRLSRVVDGTATTLYTYDPNDRLLAEGAATYAYDDNGNLVSRTDATGTSTYAYDAFGRLVRATTSGSVVELEYDVRGNRVARTVDGAATRYLIDGNRRYAEVVEERDGAGALVASYTHGLDLVRQRRGAATSYYHHDGVGSVRALTDAAQAVTDTYDFTAFGELAASTGSTANEFLFTGEQLDPNVGFYYLRARHYDPAVGRFLTMDLFPPDLFDPETLHRYAYVTNDPVNRVDPSGEFGTVAGLMTTVSIGQMLNVMSPTFLQGGIVLAGVQVFMKPGFELRNLAFEMVLAANNADSMDAALDVYRSAHQIIQLGAMFIQASTTAVDLVSGATGVTLGVAKFAQALTNVPRVTLTQVEVTRIQRFQSLAIRIETEGVSLLIRAERSSSVTLVRSMAQEFADWSKVIEEGVMTLRSLSDFILAVRG